MSGDDVYAGIDIGKSWLDCGFYPQGRGFRVANTDEGRADLASRLKERSPVVVVMEATGGYERAVARALYAASLPVSVVNPKRVRDFAKGLGHFAKTDRLDARLLALYAEKVRPRLYVPPSLEQEELGDLHKRRAQLVAMRVQEKNRLEKAGPSLHESVERHIAWLDDEITALERTLADKLSAPAFRAKAALLSSIPGIGPISLCALLALLPELGGLNRERIAALAGLAPFACDSGQHRGVRHIRGGRPALRHHLYMATLAAIRTQPALKEMYERLRQRGKPAKTALIACMRRLLCIANAVVKSRTPWKNPNPGQPDERRGRGLREAPVIA
jgi:Transposase and inactivated derivatives